MISKPSKCIAKVVFPFPAIFFGYFKQALKLDWLLSFSLILIEWKKNGQFKAKNGVIH